MPPILAFFLAAALTIYLFRRDFREKPNVTGALWLPTIWFFLIGSQTVTQWLQLAGIQMGGSYEEGTPLDAVVNIILIAAGFIALKRRRVQLGEVVRNNRWLALFFVYCFISILWSDYPFISCKRWIKILGHPIMTLVLLTEPDPEEAVARMMKRCAYVFVPFSIIFIKYFEFWGRGFDAWSGLPVNVGITNNKNIMGCMCFIYGFFFFGQLLKFIPREKSPARRQEIILCAGLLAGLAWLLHMAQSSTSWVTLAAAMAMMVFLGLRSVDPRKVGAYLVFGVIVFVVANWMFGLVDLAIGMLGKDPTLTDRTRVWHEVLKFKINPVLGTGFESFWLGERRARMGQIFWWQPNQAHNGYLETYLNLGLVGLGLMLALMVTAFRKGSQMLLTNFDFARFRLGFLIAFVLYNWTEAAFKAQHPVWFVFFIIAMDYPQLPPATVEKPPPTVDAEDPVEPDGI